MCDIWKTIEQVPDHSAMVEFFYGNLVVKNQHDEVVEIFPYRDFRRELGFWDAENGQWCELNTGHCVFETWRPDQYRPTHYRTLPPPPHTERAG